MQVIKFNTFIPLEIGDIIKKDVDNNCYEIIDIQHMLSAKLQGVIAVYLVVKDTNDCIYTFPYNENEWKII